MLNEAQKIMKLIEETEKEVKRMSDAIKVQINTKKDIKGAIVRLGSIVNQFKHARLQDWLKANDTGWQTTNKSADPPACPKCSGADPAHTITEPTLGGDISWDTAKDIIHEQWSQKWYKKTKYEKGIPLYPSEDKDLIILINPGDDNKITKKLMERRHLKNIINAGKPEPGQIAYIIDTKEAVIEGENTPEKSRRYTYLAGIRGGTGDIDFQEVYETLKRAVQKAELNGSEGISVLLAKGEICHQLRNLVECSLSETQLEALVHIIDPQSVGIIQPDNGGQRQLAKKKKSGILRET